ncbi:hypothetical protein GQ42DRAFT_40891 [Ramicandelaber brevisporus]|nr:hypothetical protein GQ42DRAFT_40891 [Ramicandelaber brevisporus]
MDSLIALVLHELSIEEPKNCTPSVFWAMVRTSATLKAVSSMRPLFSFGHLQPQQRQQQQQQTVTSVATDGSELSPPLSETGPFANGAQPTMFEEALWNSIVRMSEVVFYTVNGDGDGDGANVEMKALDRNVSRSDWLSGTGSLSPLPSNMRFVNAPLSAIHATLGDTLRITTSTSAPSLRDATLFGQEYLYLAEHQQQTMPSVALTETLSEDALRTLLLVTRTRARGITQVEVARQLGLKPNKAFFLLKRLIDSGLVIKFPVRFEGMSTSLIVHRRYALLNTQYHEHLTSTAVANLGNEATLRRTVLQHMSNTAAAAAAIAAAEAEAEASNAEPTAATERTETEQEQTSVLPAAALRLRVPLRVVRERILTALKENEEHIMPELDLRFAIGLKLGRRMSSDGFRTSIEQLAESGLVERVLVRSTENVRSMTASMYQKATLDIALEKITKRMVRCVRLVDPESKKRQVAEDASERMDIDSDEEVASNRQSQAGPRSSFFAANAKDETAVDAPMPTEVATVCRPPADVIPSGFLMGHYFDEAMFLRLCAAGARGIPGPQLRKTNTHILNRMQDRFMERMLTTEPPEIAQETAFGIYQNLGDPMSGKPQPATVTGLVKVTPARKKARTNAATSAVSAPTTPLATPLAVTPSTSLIGSPAPAPQFAMTSQLPPPVRIVATTSGSQRFKMYFANERYWLNQTHSLVKQEHDTDIADIMSNQHQRQQQHQQQSMPTPGSVKVADTDLSVNIIEGHKNAIITDRFVARCNLMLNMLSSDEPVIDITPVAFRKRFSELESASTTLASGTPAKTVQMIDKRVLQRIVSNLEQRNLVKTIKTAVQANIGADDAIDVTGRTSTKTKSVVLRTLVMRADIDPSGAEVRSLVESSDFGAKKMPSSAIDRFVVDDDARVAPKLRRYPRRRLMGESIDSQMSKSGLRVVDGGLNAEIEMGQASLVLSDDEINDSGLFNNDNDGDNEDDADFIYNSSNDDDDSDSDTDSDADNNSDDNNDNDDSDDGEQWMSDKDNEQVEQREDDYTVFKNYLLRRYQRLHGIRLQQRSAALKRQKQLKNHRKTSTSSALGVTPRVGGSGRRHPLYGAGLSPGWIFGKVLRARALASYIFNHLDKLDAVEPVPRDSNGARFFDESILNIDSMPTHMVRSIFRLTRSTPLLDAHCAPPADEHTVTLGALPSEIIDEVRESLPPSAAKAVTSLLSLLSAAGVISAVAPEIQTQMDVRFSAGYKYYTGDHLAADALNTQSPASQHLLVRTFPPISKRYRFHTHAPVFEHVSPNAVPVAQLPMDMLQALVDTHTTLLGGGRVIKRILPLGNTQELDQFWDVLYEECKAQQRKNASLMRTRHHAQRTTEAKRSMHQLANIVTTSSRFSSSTGMDTAIDAASGSVSNNDMEIETEIGPEELASHSTGYTLNARGSRFEHLDGIASMSIAIHWLKENIHSVPHGEESTPKPSRSAVRKENAKRRVETLLLPFIDRVPSLSSEQHAILAGLCRKSIATYLAGQTLDSIYNEIDQAAVKMGGDIQAGSLLLYLQEVRNTQVLYTRAQKAEALGQTVNLGRLNKMIQDMPLYPLTYKLDADLARQLGALPIHSSTGQDGARFGAQDTSTRVVMRRIPLPSRLNDAVMRTMILTKSWALRNKAVNFDAAILRVFRSQCTAKEWGEMAAASDQNFNAVTSRLDMPSVNAEPLMAALNGPLMNEGGAASDSGRGLLASQPPAASGLMANMALYHGLNLVQAIRRRFAYLMTVPYYAAFVNSATSVWDKERPKAINSHILLSDELQGTRAEDVDFASQLKLLTELCPPIETLESLPAENVTKMGMAAISRRRLGKGADTQRKSLNSLGEFGDIDADGGSTRRDVPVLLDSVDQLMAQFEFTSLERSAGSSTDPAQQLRVDRVRSEFVGPDFTTQWIEHTWNTQRFALPLYPEQQSDASDHDETAYVALLAAVRVLSTEGAADAGIRKAVSDMLDQVDAPVLMAAMNHAVERRAITVAGNKGSTAATLRTAVLEDIANRSPLKPSRFYQFLMGIHNPHDFDPVDRPAFEQVDGWLRQLHVNPETGSADVFVANVHISNGGHVRGMMSAVEANIANLSLGDARYPTDSAPGEVSNSGRSLLRPISAVFDEDAAHALSDIHIPPLYSAAFASEVAEERLSSAPIYIWSDLHTDDAPDSICWSLLLRCACIVGTIIHESPGIDLSGIAAANEVVSILPRSHIRLLVRMLGIAELILTIDHNSTQNSTLDTAHFAAVPGLLVHLNRLTF